MLHTDVYCACEVHPPPPSPPPSVHGQAQFAGVGVPRGHAQWIIDAAPHSRGILVGWLVIA